MEETPQTGKALFVFLSVVIMFALSAMIIKSSHRKNSTNMQKIPIIQLMDQIVVFPTLTLFTKKITQQIDKNQYEKLKNKLFWKLLIPCCQITMQVKP